MRFEAPDNPLFPKGAYFGEIALIGPQHHMDLHPMLDLHVLENVQVTLDWDFFWRESTHDAIYRVSDTPIVSGAANDDRYVGSQGSVEIACKLGKTRRDRRQLLALLRGFLPAQRLARGRRLRRDLAIVVSDPSIASVPRAAEKPPLLECAYFVPAARQVETRPRLSFSLRKLAMSSPTTAPRQMCRWAVRPSSGVQFVRSQNHHPKGTTASVPVPKQAR